MRDEPPPESREALDPLSTPGASGGFPWLAVTAATLTALALRLPAALQDPWIDEVWSWALARASRSFGDVLTIRSSNSHALNTLWIRLLGDQTTFLLYRLPALLAGLGSVLLAARIASRHGRSAAAAAAWIVAVSYLSLVYATEARGYALLAFASLAAFESAWNWIDSGRRRWLVIGWGCAIVGVLSHPLFVTGWAAVAAGVVARIRRERRAAWVRWSAAFLLPPLVAFGAWWFVNVRHVYNAGAPPWSLREVAAETLAWSIGLPIGNWSLLPASGFVLLVLALDVRRLALRGDRTWIVQLGAVLAVSGVTIAVLRNEYLAARYFLSPLSFWQLSLARVLGHAAERGRGGRVLALCLFTSFAAGNALHVVPFLRVGRGSIGELVRDMASRSSADPILVTGTYDFNVGLMLEWHARSLPSNRRALYVPKDELPARGVDFAVLDQPRLEGELPPGLDIGGREYEFVGLSRHLGPSGADWAVYQRR